jgi:thiol:disulfide interchange protein DsbD
VGALAALFIFAGLCLFGFFEFGARWIGVGSALSAREGRVGAFFSGVFAMAAGAPCTAPFMGATLGWAVTRPAGEILAVFGALGLGAAAPYACLSSWPALIRHLPRPGAWMVRLKKLLALPMFATALWLLWVLWRLLAPAPAPQDAVWRPWSPEAVARSRASGDTVFVDFTAAWCLSCQVNERTALAAPEVRAALTRAGVSAFRADWTSRDKSIERELAKYGRNGVPLYVVHPGGGPAVLLPELLTPGLVLDALAPSTPQKGENNP